MKPTTTAILAAFLASAVIFPAIGAETKESEKSATPQSTTVPTADPTEKAGDQTKAVEKKVASAPKTLPYQGKVAAIDPVARSFIVKNREGKEHVFFVGEKTIITKGDAPATFEDIKVDEFVRGSRLKIADGKWDALKVTIGAKEPAKPTRAPAKPAAVAEKPAN